MTAAERRRLRDLAERYPAARDDLLSLAGARRTVKAEKKERKAAEKVATRYGWEVEQANRAACVARAGVKCERFISGIHRCNAPHVERDHFWGRARDESVEGSWMLCHHDHGAKTHWRPSRAHWIQLFKEHCLRHGYAAQVEKCDRALALEEGQHRTARAGGATP